MSVRIVSAEIQYLLTEYNADGDPINELRSQTVRVFRAIHPDIWAHGDSQAFPKDAPTDALGRTQITLTPIPPNDAV
jgi:hypothetical protein